MSKIQCVYKIECLYEEVKQIYIGSSVDLKSRIRGHKGNCNNSNFREYNYPVYKFIRSRGGWNFWKVSIIKEYAGWTKEQLLIPEQEQMDLLKPELNSQNAYTGYDKKEYQKEYRETHKDEIKKQQKEYRETHKEESQEHYKQNKESYSEKASEYYKQNKDKFNVNASIKIECDKCGSMIRKGNIAKHKKTPKCINFIPQNLNMIII